MSTITAFFKATPVEVVPTTSERLASTFAKAGAALSIFSAAAEDLNLAALEQDAIAGELFDQAELLEIQAHDAIAASIENAAASQRIRDLIGSLG